jgi:uncharacterized membrane protein HdeD (DUF308 family)
MGFAVSGSFRDRVAGITREWKACQNWSRDSRDDQTAATTCQESLLIILGIILLIIGFVTKIAIIWMIGIIAVVIGAILEILGMAGHAVFGRRHYF